MVYSGRIAATCMAAPRAASTLSPSNSTSTPTWAGRSAARLCMYAVTWPSNTATRPSSSFSPMTAARASMFSATDLPSDSFSAQQALDVADLAGRGVRDDVGGELLELLVLGDEVGLAVELDQRASPPRPTRPLVADALGARLAALAAPLMRSILDRLVEVAVGLVSSAFFASIMPAPVASRSFLTSAAV